MTLIICSSLRLSSWISFVIALAIFNVRCFLYLAGISTCDSDKTIDLQFSDAALFITSLITSEISSSGESIESRYNKNHLKRKNCLKWKLSRVKHIL